MALHLTNGDSARVLIEQAGVGGRVVAWHDALHEGPVPEGLDTAASREVRARFVADAGWAPLDEARRVLAEWDATLLSSAGAEIVLWFEHDLYDQLQLLQILAIASEAGLSPMYLIQSGRFLAGLTPEELRAAWISRERTRGAGTEIRDGLSLPRRT